MGINHFYVHTCLSHLPCEETKLVVSKPSSLTIFLMSSKNESDILEKVFYFFLNNLIVFNIKVFQKRKKHFHRQLFEALS